MSNPAAATEGLWARRTGQPVLPCRPGTFFREELRLVYPNKPRTSRIFSGLFFSGGGGTPSSLLSMPVASFVATGTACGRHSVAAGARGCSPSPRSPPLPPARFIQKDETLRKHNRFTLRPPSPGQKKTSGDSQAISQSVLPLKKYNAKRQAVWFEMERASSPKTSKARRGRAFC